VPSESKLDELLRDGQPRLEAEVDAYLRDPRAFLATRERARLVNTLGAIRARLPALFGRDSRDEDAVAALDFEALVVAETVQQIENALQARAREAERFIL
jgi:hypothetical protein